jgi:hypothetical protein
MYGILCRSYGPSKVTGIQMLPLAPDFGGSISGIWDAALLTSRVVVQIVNQDEQGLSFETSALQTSGESSFPPRLQPDSE